MIKRTYKPLGNNLLVRVRVQETSEGGIAIPETAQRNSFEGTVMGVGTGCARGLKQGDTISFPQYAGHQTNNKDEVLLEEEYAMAQVIEEEIQE